MNRNQQKLTLLVLVLAIVAGLVFAGPAAAKPKFTVAWSIYVGWMPWDYADHSGILDKWSDKYGIEIEMVRMDYIPSVEAYVGKQVDAAVMTNMECLNMPAASGIDSTVLIVGDYSNGNDALLTRGGKNVKGLKGETVNLVELSVSHYLLARALQSLGKTERDINVVNTSDADMIAAWQTPDVTAAVTWNPLVAEIAAMPDAHKVFTSADIPGEIIDLTVVNTETLADNPAFGKALAGAWYETMSIMASDTEAGREARAAMGAASGTDLAGYDMQLDSTKMFYDPADAAAFARSEDLPATMDAVRTFLFDHGLLGVGAPSPDVVGIVYPDGTVQGDEGNVAFRFVTDYMDAAANGDL